MPINKRAIINAVKSCRFHPKRVLITVLVIGFVVLLDTQFVPRTREPSRPPVPPIPDVKVKSLPKPSQTQSHPQQSVSFIEIKSIVQFDLNADASTKVWTARGLNGTKLIEVPATVPGGIYSDLEKAGGIFDTPIYYRYNDVETRWVGRTHWNFSREFEVSDTLMSKKKVVLKCEGLDTVSKLYVNDVLVGSSDNMFVRYIFNIKDALKLGKNTIRVQFESPVLYAENEWNVQSKDYPVPPKCVPDEYHGECHANHIRKMQASFAWDWGPSYPSSGIWRNISIEGYDGGVIRDVMFFIKPSRAIPDEKADTQWEFKTRIWYDTFFTNETAPTDGVNITASISISTRSNKKPKVPIVVHTIKMHLGKQDDWTVPHEHLFIVSGDKVKLWWPNGYGEQNLYNVEITYSNSVAPDESSVRLLPVGFRSIELIQDPINSSDPAKGLTFYFKVNGVPVYAKGTNSIPIHVLPERATSEMTRWLFDSSKEAHFNMIRVWGGGIYESEEFYQYADETGIMIWQDFMFACSMYPTRPNFLASVHQEVESQVKRIQHHPSIAIWAANNENEVALQSGWYGTSVNFTLYKRDYIKLYIDTILNYVKELDPSRSCLSSSPTNGKETEEEGWVAQNPYSNFYGDVHFYNYYMDGWDWQGYPSARFSSEYGFQAWPSPETLLTGTSKELKDWVWDSPMMNHRQHHPGGQSEIEEQIKSHLPIPSVINSTEAFPAMLFMAQITQAMSIKTETEFYRRLKGQLSENGEGQNMGALYWQLNDIWQGASWASIESNGRWKMLHYYAKNMFAPIIISPFDKQDGNISVHLVSDSMAAFKGSLRVRLFRLGSLTPILDYKVPISADPLSAKEVHRINKKNTSLEQCKNTVDVCLLHFSMPGVPDNFLYLEYPKESSSIHDPKLTFHIQKGPDNRTFNVKLKSKAIAPFVFLSMKSNDILGHFSDNGFNMVDSDQVIKFKSQKNITFSEFQAQLQVVSLHDFVAKSVKQQDITRAWKTTPIAFSSSKRSRRKKPPVLAGF